MLTHSCRIRYHYQQQQSALYRQVPCMTFQENENLGILSQLSQPSKCSISIKFVFWFFFVHRPWCLRVCMTKSNVSKTYYMIFVSNATFYTNRVYINCIPNEFDVIIILMKLRTLFASPSTNVCCAICAYLKLTHTTNRFESVHFTYSVLANTIQLLEVNAMPHTEHINLSYIIKPIVGNERMWNDLCEEKKKTIQRNLIPSGVKRLR